MIDKIDAIETVISVAMSHLWIREIGSNRGQAVEAILKSVSLPPGSPWCAAFVSFIGRSVLDRHWPLPMVGGCATLGEAASKKGLMSSEPVTGAIFLLWSQEKRRYHHTGFIADSPGGSHGTVEGNTSPDGSPEGTGVFSRIRDFKSLDQFIHWWR